MEQIEEERFEITLDVHGIRDGPQHGRLRVLNNVSSFCLCVVILSYMYGYALNRILECWVWLMLIVA